MSEANGNMPVNLPNFDNGLSHKTLIDKVQALWDEIGELGNQWVEGSLKTADPNAADVDGYAKPLITVAELLRLQRMHDTSRFVYKRAIEFADKHCQDHGIDLYRGAIYANYAIAQFEIGKYPQGLSWLHAAANEDIRHKDDVMDIYGSYAFSDEGIFGQWLNAHVIKNLPATAVDFVNAQLGLDVNDADIREFIKWLAGKGDMSLISGIVEYAGVRGMTDYHAHAVRLTCIRDLATLFEVLLKMLGAAHKDPEVSSVFETPPTLAGIVCHMHYQASKRTRRRKPALNANKSPGLFHNSLNGWPVLLDAIDGGIDYCSDRGHNVDQVWNHLNNTQFNADASADAVAKRFLMTYKLRNETSHNLNPTAPAMVPHYDEFHLWLLQAALSAYFWAKKTGDMNL